MEEKLNEKEENIFILGAGASFEYKLPLWKDLNEEIKKELEKDNNNKYLYKKEIKEWLDKVEEDKQYKTIDECIAIESRKNKKDGLKIEIEIFLIIKDIFENKYEDLDETGWIHFLNQYFLFFPQAVNWIYLINYNYDSVFEKNILLYDYLSEKEKLLNKKKLEYLKDLKIRAIFPHSTFYLKDTEHVVKIHNSYKNEDEHKVTSMTCYDSDGINFSDENFNFKREKILFILGLGGGLKYNLNKLNLSSFVIKAIYITITDEKEDENIKMYLVDKFKISNNNIFIYRDCGELINKVFLKKE